MSHENAELVRRLLPSPDAELAVLFRDTTTAAVYTVREGKVARAEFYSHRSEALKAVDLEE